MKKLLMLCISLSFSLWLGACAPKVANLPAPTPAVSPSSPVAPPQTTPPPTADNTALQKIVEAAQKEGKVTLYAYSYVGDLGLAMAEAFKKKYGIQVDIITGRGAEFLERLKTEKRTGRIVGDILEGSQTHTRNAKITGLTFSVADLPAFREKDVWAVDPRSLDPEGYIVGHTVNIYANYINTNLVKPADEPRSWFDLLEERWKGEKITVLDPNISTGLYYFEVQISRSILSQDFLQKLAAQRLRFARSSAEAGLLLSQGEVAIYLQGTSSLMAEYAKQGAPVKAIAMKEGALVGMMMMTPIAGSPHPQAARLFINWLLSEEGQMVQGKAWGVPSVRKGVPDFSPAPLRVPATNAILITDQDSERMAKSFVEKLYVPIFRK